MKIGVLSDTHDQGDLIRKAVEYFNHEKVEWVFHCGDWVSPFILYFFQSLQAPLRGVFGNTDRQNTFAKSKLFDEGNFSYRE